MTNKILYENHLKKSGEIISLEEWMLSESKSKLKLKKMTSYWDALKRYGIIGLASYITGDKSTVDLASGGLLSIPLGLIFYAGYKKSNEACIHNCTTVLCDNKCYLKSCVIIIKEIYTSINIVKAKAGDQRKVLKKLDKHLIKWVQRYNKYKIKIKKIKKQMSDDKKELLQKAKAARARYYGSVS
jgi:hypothetical protein